MNIKGKLFKIFDTQQVSATFKKREFVLEYAENPMYPQHVLFQMTQDKCSVLDGYEAGQMVEIDFNLRGREWISPQGEKKYFNSLECWRINQAESNQVQPVKQAVAAPKITLQDLEADDSDLPF